MEGESAAYQSASTSAGPPLASSVSNPKKAASPLSGLAAFFSIPLFKGDSLKGIEMNVEAEAAEGKFGTVGA
ncbi:hypothetical protein R70331_29780 [Paenibacillus sp. FSL R7-0331]|nr:hypothetical protein R70331_29780 [Paenibacillus sp. FSL R7-0331]